jgi:hypothetical protein
MAYGVTKWPRGGDPRSPSFGMRGFAWGAVPPWIWEVSTTGALAPFEEFNTGVYLAPVFISDSQVVYNYRPPGDWWFYMEMAGRNNSIPDTALWSKNFIAATVEGFDGQSVSDVEYSYPAAIRQFTIPAFTDDPYFPNSFLLTPVAWDGVQ